MYNEQKINLQYSFILQLYVEIRIEIFKLTIVGILTFITMISSESLKARKTLVFQHFRFYEQFECHVQLR